MLNELITEVNKSKFSAFQIAVMCYCNMDTESRLDGVLIAIIDECSVCENWNRCYGGAKCVTYAQTGRLFEKDVNCFK